MFIVLKQTSFDLDNLLIPLDWLEKSNEKILSELK